MDFHSVASYLRSINSKFINILAQAFWHSVTTIVACWSDTLVKYKFIASLCVMELFLPCFIFTFTNDTPTTPSHVSSYLSLFLLK